MNKEDVEELALEGLVGVVVTNLKLFRTFVEIVLCYEAGARSQNAVASVFESISMESISSSQRFSPATVCRTIHSVEVLLQEANFCSADESLFISKGIGRQRVPSLTGSKWCNLIQNVLVRLKIANESQFAATLESYRSVLTMGSSTGTTANGKN